MLQQHRRSSESIRPLPLDSMVLRSYFYCCNGDYNVAGHEESFEERMG